MEPKIHHINQYKRIFIGMSFGTNPNLFLKLIVNIKFCTINFSMTKMIEEKELTIELLKLTILSLSDN